MSYHEIQTIFKFCSYLLSYPNEEFIGSFEEVKNELQSLSITNEQAGLITFIEKAKKLTSSELISTYVYTFDFGKKSNLYVTYMTNGEQRERGMDLLFLKNCYKLNGFDVTDSELPDYLPIMLEFASQVDQERLKPVFERYMTNIKEIKDHLDPKQNIYGHIMSSVLSAMEAAGITKTVRRSEEICSNSFYG
ncbi:nitrate reductase molybdenum cofactor assembly chaperone [Cytobacillus sp. Hz8]|uniref:nitrate reductase molybdenum cofactor assembly chaperone n=1 Tax=Cytobacillus sp. Hz8 TaxID=3347168 RepID=UPI0035D9512D